jgi:radical SAM superfamily enzyme YgiQ (UPF0313 family)
MKSQDSPPKVVFLSSPKKIFSIEYPIGLGYIGSILMKHNYDVTILNYTDRAISIKKIVKEIVGLHPDFLGFTVYTFSYNFIKKIVEDIKELIPDVVIILGGPHVSAFPQLSLEEIKADFAIVGEAEYCILEIIRRIESNCYTFGDINGLAYWREGISMFNPGRNIIDDLDSLPFPCWKHILSREYNDVAGGIFSKKGPVAPILTSRGCPQKCKFCASFLIHGRKLRKRSPISVVDEIELLKNKYGVKEFLIYDDTFSEDRLHAISICEEVIKRNLDIVWRTPVGIRLDTVDEELLKIFKKSGCYQLGFGIESFSEKILKDIRKSLTNNNISEKIKLVKKYKIETFGYFILGLPEETEDSIRETIKFASSSQLDFVSFSHAIPFPGTEIFNNNYKKTNLYSLDFNNFYCYNNRPFNISKISTEKLKKYYLLAYLNSYLTPIRTVKVLKNLLNSRPKEILKLLKILFYIFRNLF